MQEHGHLEFSWNESVLTVGVFGPFNEEGARAAAQAYLTAIANRPTEIFSVIECLDENSLGSPKTMIEVSQLWNFLGQNKCKSLAIIYANDLQRSLAQRHIPKFGKTFDNLEDALVWIEVRNKPKAS